MDQTKTPLFDALMEYRDNQWYSFHVPGHKDGLTFHDRGKSIYESILGIDATEVHGLDDLYEPVGAIAEAQDLLMDLYGTVKSYLLVNGSTVGNLAMIMSLCQPGDEVLVQRNSHKSIFNALKLARVKPIFLSPDIDSNTLIPSGLNIEMVRSGIRKNPIAKALILTYPNYYGIAKKEYKEIIKLAKKKGLFVLVDEAHGAHFPLSHPVPESTLKMGADVVVHSAHKTLPAMTMGSYLHVNSKRVSLQAIERVLAILQTSSPSYPIMASLDLARAYLASITDNRLQIILDRINTFKQDLINIGLDVIEGNDGEHDPFKIVISTGVNGFQLQKYLERAGIYPEMADPEHVLLTLAIDEHPPYQKVVHALERYRKEFSLTNKGAITAQMPPTFSTLAVPYELADRLMTEEINISSAKGRVAAQMVVPYPPGVPVLVDGELVQDDHIRQIKTWQSVGARFHGLGDAATISVYRL